MVRHVKAIEDAKVAIRILNPCHRHLESEVQDQEQGTIAPKYPTFDVLRVDREQGR